MMLRLPRTHLKALLATASIAAVLSGISVVLDWRASRALSSEDPTAFVLCQHVLWGVGNVLATAATVLVLLALSAGASSLSAPWRGSLRFMVFVLSPVIVLFFAASFYSLLTLPPADALAAVFISPGRLIATLPTLLGIVALFVVGMPRANVNVSGRGPR